MRRQILLAIVLVGTGIIKRTDLSDDQQAGLLNEDFGEIKTQRSGVADKAIEFIKLTDKGISIYEALLLVAAIGTKW